MCENESSSEVRRRIEAALREAGGWTVVSVAARGLTESEQQLAERLAGTATPGAAGLPTDSPVPPP